MPDSPATTPTVHEMVQEAVTAAQDRKAIDVRVLALAEVADFTDYFLVCSGATERQVQAISDAVEERLRQRGMRPLHVEGYRHGWWTLLDYGDFVFHVFTDEKRAYYGLERLWADAADVSDRFTHLE
ncbi:MAG: ribosome silencing factor [Thermoanaerobaculia bacterium]